MTGYFVLLAFMVMGVIQAEKLLDKHAPLIRLWLGAVMGLMEMMWLPSLFAFFCDFTMKAQLLALSADLVFTLLCALWPRRVKRDKPAKEEQMNHWLIALLLIPALAVTAYLQYTHTLREIDGALYSGQSTYGDLCMHLSFATGLIGQSYPPEYTLLPGTTLGYPFLVDALSSTMLMFGTPLAQSFYVPGTIMIGLIDLGFILLTWKLTRRQSVVVLAFILFFFNGGLGFIQTGTDAASLHVSLYEYYKTPTNLPDLNLRWVNALCDLLIPQRTLMAGWLCVIPALYLLVCAVETGGFLSFLGLELWAGPMVMIHTHSFLALGMISMGVMLVNLIRAKGERKIQLAKFALYGLTTCALAFPQLLKWTFPQTMEGGSLRLLFNWVNNDGRNGLIEPYFLFWIKNVGLVYLFIIIAGISAKKTATRGLALGALFLYILAENVVFQPNVYDNNKLFYVAFIAMLPMACELMMNIYDRLKGIRGRIILAVFILVVSTLSGAISIARECISGSKGNNYQLFSKSQAEAAEFIQNHTPEDAVFLTADNHNNAVAALTGRKIVCGAGLYLYFHGLDYYQNETDAAVMLAYPEQCQALFEQYQIDYIFVSSYERAEMNADPYLIDADVPKKSAYRANEDEIAELYALVYSGGEWYDQISIYAVSERATRLTIQ